MTVVVQRPCVVLGSECPPPISLDTVAYQKPNTQVIGRRSNRQ